MRDGGRGREGFWGVRAVVRGRDRRVMWMRGMVSMVGCASRRWRALVG